MTNLATHITQDFSYIHNVINELQQSNLPLIVLGAGDRGYATWRFLTQRSIMPTSVTVHRRYWQAGATLPRTSVALDVFEDVMSTYASCNVITGFSFTQIPQHICTTYPQIANMYYINVGIYDQYLYDQPFYQANYASFDWLFQRVADKESRDILIAHINGRIGGHHIDYPLAPRGKAQYFLDDICDWHTHEVLIDAGAFDGDTTAELLQKMPASVESASVYCFEPDKNHIEKIRANSFITGHPRCTLQIIPAGLWTEDTTLRFANMDDDQGTISESGNITVHVTSLDSFFASITERITIIKMDIEGSELQALIGASTRIKQDKPLLAICAYHKLEDLIEIPQFIHSLVPEYRFYLRPHISTPTELVLFCKI